ncbi:MAG: hypothetical protein U5J95_04870 [Balneolaceae bacterium]|nr:hypothetical protein [Balneolaceae bacterium]
MKRFNSKLKIITGTLLIGLTIASCSGEEKKDQQTAQVFDCIEAPADSMMADTVTAKIDINKGTEEEFKTIPDVGDNMVHEFEEYRPYASIQQFRKEIGKYVDSTQVAAYEQHIYVPIKANESDAATMMQIPGLDAEEAEALISGRPYATQEDFINALSEYIDESEMAVAKVYLGC